MIRSKNILTISFILLLAACSLTTTNSKEVELKDEALVQTELNGIVGGAKINVNGKESITGKDTTSVLEVKITNGQNIPSDKDEMKVIGKSIAGCIKKHLKDNTGFDSYSVRFISRDESIVGSKESYTEFAFTSAELL
jgi:hypothetical protein